MAKDNKDVLKRIAFAESEFKYAEYYVNIADLRNTGNKFTGEGEYKKAIESYTSALDMLDKAKKDDSMSALKRATLPGLKPIPSLKKLLTGVKYLQQNEGINIVKNPSGEVVNKRNMPINWGHYSGGSGSESEWGISTDEFHTGERSVFLRAVKYYTCTSGRKFIGSSLVVGDSDAYTGRKAYPCLENTEYYFSFWLKGDVDAVDLNVTTWTTEEALRKDRKYAKTSLETIVPKSDWTQYTGRFLTPKGAKKFVLKIGVYGYSDEGKNLLGTIYVDDVCISPMQKKAAVYLPRLDGGMGGERDATIRTLIESGAWQVNVISDLSAKNLAKYKCLIFPSSVTRLGDRQKKKQLIEGIRNYVKEGGGVYFQHSTCGYAPHRWILGNTTVFPEICKGVKVKTGVRPGKPGNEEGKRLIISAIHPLTKGYKVGDEGSHTYWDHMALIKGEKGQVIVKDKNKDPVVIAGRIGKGRVVFDGTVPADEKTDKEVEKITGIEPQESLLEINW